MSKISEILQPIGPDYFGAYLNAGIQLYHLIEWVLNQTGKANVTVMTFSISEEFIRKIYFLKKSGLIGEITVILDFKAMQKTEKLTRFAGNVFDKIHYVKSHAKLVLLENETHKITITGSQNATRGNREESGVVSSKQELFYFFKSEILRITQ